MKKNLRYFIGFILLMMVATFTLESCRLLRGDPRKNCNHPKHGEYMREQRLKKVGF